MGVMPEAPRGAPGASGAGPATAPDRARRFPDDPVAPPRSRGDAWVWFVVALAGFVGGQVVALFLVDVAASVAGKGAQLTQIAKMAAPPEWYVLSSLVGLWTGFALAPWLASRIRGTRTMAADLGIRFRWIDLAGIGIGVAGQALVAVLYAPFIDHLHNFSAPAKKLTGSAHGWGFFAIAVFTVVGAPFFEELFFRGLLLRALVRLIGPLRSSGRAARRAGLAGAVVLDGLLFGLAHGELVQLAGLAVFGVILAAVSLRTGRQGMNMVAHATFNLFAILAILDSRGGVLH